MKKAAPLLVNVAFLIGFFWLLFAIVGVQIFKSSFRRTCVWYDGDPFSNTSAKLNPYALDSASGNPQFCGGHLDVVTGEPRPWLNFDLTKNNRTDNHKGYLCPRHSLCVEGENPYNGTVSFDNVLQSLQLVFVIMSSNTFSDLLYYTTDSDFLAAALFFAFGIVIMSFWLMNLLVAVITSSFQVIREEGKGSAFTMDETVQMFDDDDEPPKASALKRLYDKTYWVWIGLIVFDLVVQSLRSAAMGPRRKNFISKHCQS